ncbi:MAG: PLP-dependent aminotransferase family protein [Sporomusaceae bacterium]|nr:PLP-dependent aminotransferase family protein [Sporomusaceae bacterium]
MFILDNNDRRPLHVKLYNQIKNQILSGKLTPTTKLPSVRNLSQELSISRNTVEYVYEQLCTEGFIYSKPQSGYYISLLEQEFSPSLSQKIASPLHQADKKTYLFDFHPAHLSSDSFPIKSWRKQLTDCLQEDPKQFALYSDPCGEIELRREIQQYLERFRGVSCAPEQIIICCGIQDSMSNLAQILRSDHSVLAVEDPGHWIPRSVFQNHSYSIRSIPVNSDGIDLDYLKSTDSTIVYVTPSHQFPLGYIMPAENRLKLIHWAETIGGVIIEDDYDSELRYHGKPIPALQGLHPEGKIVYIGTFSKILSPALRISYMVLPYQLLSTYNKLFGKYAATVSLLEQRTLLRFMQQGYLEKHLRKMRTKYKKKHDALVKSVDCHFGNHAHILEQGAGLHIVLELVDCSLDEQELIRRAEEKSIRLLPLPSVCQKNKAHAPRIMLGFGGMSPDDLDKGIELLSRVWNLS